MKYVPVLIALLAGLGRTPSGVRGLKLFISVIVALVSPSHPVRGAWIEIDSPASHLRYVVVAPRQGCVD